MLLKKKLVGFLVVCFALSFPLYLNAEVRPPASSSVQTKIEPAGPALSPLSLGRIPKFLTREAGQCSAGGPGSTSCTYGSCEIEAGTCKGNDYPCCGPDVCGCSNGAMF